MKTSKQLLVLIMSALVITQTMVAVNARPETSSKTSTQEFPNDYSIILMIGDGMGFNHVTLGQLIEVGEHTNLTMSSISTQFSVYTRNINEALTDSAASGTAIATGEKTTNGRIAQSINGTNLETILEYAIMLGKATGVATTTKIQHATPACFISHVESRGDYRGIMDQIIANANVDVLLGGGNSTVTTEDLLEMTSKGYTLVTNRTSLAGHTSGKLLGLFAESHMSYEEGRNYTTTPSLAEMTNKTLKIVSQDPDGFFMMIEGGRIDHAGHGNNKVGVALETIEFDKAVKLAVAYVDKHPNTLLLVTADHETGGLSIVSNTLDDIRPTSGLTAEQNRTLRISRVDDVVVEWSTGGHTNDYVPLYCYGEAVKELVDGHLIDNTQIHTLMHDYFSGKELLLEVFISPITISKLWVLIPTVLLTFIAVRIVGTISHRKGLKQRKHSKEN